MTYEDDERRDSSGLPQASWYGSEEASKRGVGRHDTAATAAAIINAGRIADYQTMVDRERAASASSGSSDSGPTRLSDYRYVALIVGAFLLFPVVAALIDTAYTEYPKWRHRLADEGYAETSRQIGAARAHMYGDFSTVKEWPARLQMHAAPPQKSLYEIVGEIFPDRKSTSAAQEAAVGARIWFRLAAEGEAARDSIAALHMQPGGVPGRGLRAITLSKTFLRRECAKGVELACLDAAKAIAGLLLAFSDGCDEMAINKEALAELPTTGPLSTLPAVIELRHKISQPRQNIGLCEKREGYRRQ